MTMRRDSLMSGTIALALAATINRVIGFLFRAYLVRAVGQETIGLFQMAYPLYAAVMTVAVGGLSVAMAKLTAEYRKQGSVQRVKGLLRTGYYFAAFMGTAGMSFLLFTGKILSQHMLDEPRTYFALMALAPAIPLVALASTLRGYFQGMRYMRMVAIGLVIEQIVHVYASLRLALFFKTQGPGQIAMGLAFGNVAGEAAGLMALLLPLAAISIWRRPAKARLPLVLGELTTMVFPVTLGRVFMSVASAVNTILIPRALRYMGYNATQAAVAFGQLNGMAVNVLFIPAVLSFPFASNLLPLMAENSVGGGNALRRRSFHRALTLAMLLGVPFSVLFVLVGPDICELLFGVREAGDLLSTMGWVAWLIYLQHITTATLQGLGKPAIPTRNAAICTILASAAMIALTLAFPGLGITAAALASMVGITSGAFLGLTAVFRELGGVRQTLSIMIRAALAGAISLALCHMFMDRYSFTPITSVLAGGVMIAVTFFPLSLALGLHRLLRRNQGRL
jgi:stage V sporulation protein B